jgi:hypothetical protein
LLILLNVYVQEQFSVSVFPYFYSMKTLPPFLLTFFSFSLLNAQHLEFTPATSIPLSDKNGSLQQNAWAGGINDPIWSAIDINGDGLKDLYMYDRSNNRVGTFLNDGSQGPHAYHFAPEYASRFPKGLTDGWGVCYDYNCDGKEDFFALSATHSGIEVWRNDYTLQTGLQFTKVSSELLEDWSGPQPINIFVSSIYIPAFSDIDNDGDMDIIGFNNPENGKFAFHKNLSMELYGTCDSLQFVFDDQCWGNFTMSLDFNSVSSFHNIPCGTPSPSGTGAGNSETEATFKDLATLCVIDIDGDGVKELLIGEMDSPNILLVHNGGTPANAEMDTSDTSFPSYDVPVNFSGYLRNAYIDVDNDGRRDLLSSAGIYEDKQGVAYYTNTGTDASPVFSFQKRDFLQDEMVETGSDACPVFFDADGDGLSDIIVAHGFYEPSISGMLSRLSYYKNTGTAATPAFQLMDEDYASLSSYNIPFPIAATFGDIDGDGDGDMIIGDWAGNLHLFSNSAGAGNPASFSLTIPMYMGIDVGNSATPQLVDLDNDGLLDLVVGKQRATFDYYHNDGTAAAASFSSAPTIDTLGHIFLAQNGILSGYSVPYIFSYGGHHQMLTANMHGDIYYYENIDNNLNGTFSLVDTIVNGELGIRTSGCNMFVSGGDINNDSLPDMIAGLFTGGIQIYYGSDSHIGIDEIGNAKLFSAYPNPADKELHVEVGDNTAGIDIYNILGEKITMKSHPLILNRSLQIDVSEFPDGIYVVVTSDGKTIRRSRVIIQH